MTHEQLKHLGAGAEAIPSVPEASILETFENPSPGASYTVTITTSEFTSMCPKTGQPDFGVITIEYVPGGLCVESKSLKLYLAAYRSFGIFYEALVNRIADDLAAVAKPIHMLVTGEFTARGGLEFEVVAER